jgi:ribosomal protein S18 acetylase RimI-like enzyme
MTEPSFRRAAAADAARLAAFMTRTFRDTYSSDHSGNCRPSDVEAYIAAFFTAERQRTEIADPSLRTILAEVDGALAGYAQVRFDSPTAVAPGSRPVELARFYVDKTWHGQGLAAALMREAIAAAGAADPFWLGVYKWNHRAIAFYAKQGFAIAGEQSFTMGDDTQDDWVLVRRATAAPSGPSPRP